MMIFKCKAVFRWSAQWFSAMYTVSSRFEPKLTHTHSTFVHEWPDHAITRLTWLVSDTSRCPVFDTFNDPDASLLCLVL